jgi:hypothetical protein
MALGRSERVNSGVMFATGPEGASFFEKVLSSLTTQIPAADRQQLKYENGNVIYCAQHSTDVETIDPRWNNTFQPQLDDYFRHYTGPMRDEYQRSPTNAFAFRVARSLAATPTAQPVARDAAFVARLRDLTQQCCRIYPAFLQSDGIRRASVAG